MLFELRRKFGKSILVLHENLCESFDSVQRWVLWKILQLREIPIKLLVLIQSLYSGLQSAVTFGSTLTEYFPAATSVRQGFVLTPLLFNIYMDWVLGRNSWACFSTGFIRWRSFCWTWLCGWCSHLSNLH